MCFLFVHFLRVSAHAETGSGAATNAALSILFTGRDLAIIAARNRLVLSRAVLAVVEVGGELNALIHRLFQRIRGDSSSIVCIDASLCRQSSVATNAATGQQLIVCVLCIQATANT